MSAIGKDGGPTKPTAPLLVLLLVAAGCAGPGASTEGAPRSNPNSITGAEVRQASADNLYEALLEIRPQWLRARPRASLRFQDADEPVVYMFGIRYGSPRTLSRIHVNWVRAVEFIRPVDATTRYGTGHSGGVIRVDAVRNQGPGPPPG